MREGPVTADEVPRVVVSGSARIPVIGDPEAIPCHTCLVIEEDLATRAIGDVLTGPTNLKVPPFVRNPVLLKGYEPMEEGQAACADAAVSPESVTARTATSIALLGPLRFASPTIASIAN